VTIFATCIKALKVLRLEIGVTNILVDKAVDLGIGFYQAPVFAHSMISWVVLFA